MHSMKFSNSNKPFNIIDVLSDKLNTALKDSTLPADHMKRVIEVSQMLEPYKQYVLYLMKKKEYIFRSSFQKNVYANNKQCNDRNIDSKESWNYKNPKQNTTVLKSKEEGNWRTLKPDSNPNPNIFSRGYHKQISNNGLEIRSRLNSQK